jgi:hypothetical protein
MWKSARAATNPTIRKFVERAGRRVGDRVAYVTNPLYLTETAAQTEWLEDRAFEEQAALRDWPGLKTLFDRARRTGIALCIKG